MAPSTMNAQWNPPVSGAAAAWPLCISVVVRDAAIVDATATYPPVLPES